MIQLKDALTLAFRRALRKLVSVSNLIQLVHHRMGSCRLTRIDIDNGKLKQLPIERRFTFFFLGHAFNEIMALQKMLARAYARNEDIENADLPRMEGANANSVLIIRLLASKILEAVDRLHEKPVRPVLAAEFLPLFHRGDGEARLRELNKMVGGNKWMRAVRNGHTFHYPGLDDWKATLESDKLDYLYIYVGESVGNSLFVASDHVANFATFAEAGQGNVQKQFTTLLDELISIAGHVGDFLQEAAVGFAHKHLLAKAGEITLTDVPALYEIHLPYFVGDQPHGK